MLIMEISFSYLSSNHEKLNKFHSTLSISILNKTEMTHLITQFLIYIYIYMPYQPTQGIK